MTKSRSDGEARVDAIMLQIPKEARLRWCGLSPTGCACLGCVQIWNRKPMYDVNHKVDHKGDPEYIIEEKIPKHIYDRFKVTKGQYKDWLKRHGLTEYASFNDEKHERRRKETS